MAEELHYEPMLEYVARIRKANTPLGILLNTDFLTDLLDQQLNKEEVSKRYGIKTQMERNKYQNNRWTARRNVQMHRLFRTIREVNSTGFKD